MSPQVSLGTDPSRVGPYQIERKLGAGGMGTVFLGRHEQTGKEVAIKVLAPSLAREEGLVARFMREIDALQKLKNPHVVEFYDHGVDGEMYYYAMEYVEGETLTSRLRREKRLPWRVVIDYSIQICVALKAAHDAGIIHRDLKPSNLLISPDDQVKLTDFGVAQVFAGSKLTITGGIIGTAEYMSPEQGQGQRITKRSDLYSLGAVMYVMLTGRPPFSGKTTLDVVHKHKYGQFDRPRLIVPAIPTWLDDVVCQLMEKDPDKRFADAYVLNRKLNEVLGKVDYANNEVTHGDSPIDGTMTTMAVDSVPASQRSRSGGVGSATLMRDLMRAEIDAAKTRTDLGRALQNTWVLVGMLVVLVAAVGYAISANRRAADDSESSSTAEDTGTDIERFRALARRQQRDGDLAGAEKTLSALAILLDGNPEYEPEHRRVEQALRLLRKKRETRQPDRGFITAALKRADSLAQDQQRPEAVRIWQSLVDLYGNDPTVADEVAAARRNLAEPAPPSKGTESTSK